MAKKNELELVAGCARRIKSLSPEGKQTAALFIDKKVPFEDSGTIRGLLADYADLSAEMQKAVRASLPAAED